MGLPLSVLDYEMKMVTFAPQGWSQINVFQVHLYPQVKYVILFPYLYIFLAILLLPLSYIQRTLYFRHNLHMGFPVLVSKE